MLNVQVLAAPVAGFGTKRSTQMDFEAGHGWKWELSGWEDPLEMGSFPGKILYKWNIYRGFSSGMSA